METTAQIARLRNSMSAVFFWFVILSGACAKHAKSKNLTVKDIMKNLQKFAAHKCRLSVVTEG